ncbi:hypothetical protein [Nocardia sp. alder85J]|uniref:hypothetical protein n=1 Tax=Nocardia sp. alder85J TaxID=2862949 RepID=UPI001CD4B05B|nr:hypothetical protein [Nocardia sp. alder85J]MCX4093383.1 hypothetical protein [Nocardia sp. alder85J]
MDRSAVGTRLSVSFSPAVLSSLSALARDRATSTETLIGIAVADLLDSFGIDRDTAITAVAAMMEIEHIPDRRRARRNFDPAGEQPAPRDLGVGEVRLDEPTLARLAVFCRGAGLSRARAIRMAVDRCLFHEVTGSEFEAAPDRPRSPSARRP